MVSASDDPTSWIRRLKQALRRRPVLFRLARGGLYGLRLLYGRLCGLLRGTSQWRAYCRAYSVLKLHLGCGDLSLPGWFNTDGFPRRLDVAFCDVAGRFPFPDSSFDYVFSEHMIEHVPFNAAKHMILECFRVLKPGGTLRLSTPDLDRILALRQPSTALEKAYLLYALRRIPEAIGDQPSFVINEFLRSWGHTFIYDKPTLAALLELSGFDPVIECMPGESANPELRDLERHGETFPIAEFNLVESMVFEATKPPCA